MRTRTKSWSLSWGCSAVETGSATSVKTKSSKCRPRVDARTHCRKPLSPHHCCSARSFGAVYEEKRNHGMLRTFRSSTMTVRTAEGARL
eukprot:15444156-Alexandrium_andersonii.AAC.1